MEKSYSRPLTKRGPHVSKKPFDISVVVRPSSAAPKAEQRQDKLSRKDISRCINIWASMYLTPDDSTESHDLSVPPRPWLGRNPSGLKRFE